MSVENPDVAHGTDNEAKPVNGEQRVNGVSNGHSISSDKHRSSHKSSNKDRHRDREKERDKNRDVTSSKSSSNREKEGHKHSSSSSKDKNREKDRHSSSHKSSNRDKDKEREKDKDRNKDREKDKNRDKDKEKDKDKERDKDKSRDREKDKEKHRSKDDKNREREKDKNREHKSSNREKDRDKEKSSTSTSQKEKESNEKNRDKDKEQIKNSTSSSSKDHKHSSSSSSKHRDKDRHHSSSNRDKDRNRDKERRDRDKDKDKKKQEEIKKEEKNIINEELKKEGNIHFNYNGSDKPESQEFDVKPVAVKQEFLMNVSQASSCDYSMSQFREDETPFVIKEEADETNNDIKVEDDEEDIPLAKRKIKILDDDDDDEDEIPLIARKKIKKEEKKNKKKKRELDDEFDDEFDEFDEKPKKKKLKKEKKEKEEVKTVINTSTGSNSSPTKGGRKKKEEPTQDVWKWWEEEKKEDGNKWNFLEHKGPVFAPDYIPLPENIKFFYDGKEMKLSQDSEEIACFYAKMLEHDYTSKKVFNDNFFKDWRKSMTPKEREKISNLSKCDFKQLHVYFQEISEKNKNRTKEEKAALKAENERLLLDFGFCTIDGHKEKIGNFKIEPPGLFRGRGEHPKMGMVKRRVMPEDVLINCSKTSKIPVPPKGHKWREIKHDNNVTWLASWQENVQGQVKYIMLNPSSKLKGEKDMQKYETARRLHKTIDKLRSTYREEWKSKEMRIRQRAVALYFIDKLALRAGNEKDEDQADTVGCCSLRVEHITLHREIDGKENVVVFDFLGKDSIRYYNEVEVEKRVFKNLELFKENKKDGDDLFDRLNTSVLNEHLRDLMEGLTAKVFRTYNASITLQNQLDDLTEKDSSIPEKLLAYNRANRAVAILCNHQRSIPKGHSKTMANLKEKIVTKKQQVEEGEKELKTLTKAAKRGSNKEKLDCDKKKKLLERLKEQLKKLELMETDRDENKTIALGTSKLNYLDPRISVAWCKKYQVPIEKIFNKTQRDKFRWAIDMATEDYTFA